jgi:hypothetical protein
VSPARPKACSHRLPKCGFWPSTLVNRVLVVKIPKLCWRLTDPTAATFFLLALRITVPKLHLAPGGEGDVSLEGPVWLRTAGTTEQSGDASRSCRVVRHTLVGVVLVLCVTRVLCHWAECMGLRLSLARHSWRTGPRLKWMVEDILGLDSHVGDAGVQTVATLVSGCFAIKVEATKGWTGYDSKRQ